MSASCSIEPDSRRSDSCGRLSSRCSTARLSCDKADDRHVQFLGELLQAAADLRNFLYAIVVQLPPCRCPGAAGDNRRRPARCPSGASGGGRGCEARRWSGPAYRRCRAAGSAARPRRGRADANSCWLILPVRICSEVILDCSARMRVTSCSDDISRLKMRPARPPTWPARSRPPDRCRNRCGGGECHVGRERGLAHARTSGDDDQVGSL